MYPWRDPPQIPQPPTDPRRCPQCGETEECTGDQRWQHERDYRSSEATLLRRYSNQAVMFDGKAWEVTR